MLHNYSKKVSSSFSGWFDSVCSSNISRIRYQMQAAIDSPFFNASHDNGFVKNPRPITDCESNVSNSCLSQAINLFSKLERIFSLKNKI
jgi:hypothetical protein